MPVPLFIFMASLLEPTFHVSICQRFIRFAAISVAPFPEAALRLLPRHYGDYYQAAKITRPALSAAKLQIARFGRTAAILCAPMPATATKTEVLPSAGARWLMNRHWFRHCKIALLPARCFCRRASIVLIQVRLFTAGDGGLPKLCVLNGQHLIK